MVKVSDCTCCDCESAAEKEQIKERALSSINKVYTTDAKTYYPDGTGMVTLPIPSAEQIAQMDANTELIKANTADITALNQEMEDVQGTVGKIPTGYTLYRNGDGKVMLQAEATDGSLINSNTLDMVIPYQYDLISGTTNRSFKLQITMSDGSSYTTNDFVIPEGGGTDVTVTGIVLSKDTSDVNRFHVGINLSDGTMIDSGYISMVDSVGAAVADGKLTITVNGVSSVPVELPEGATYSAGDGIKIESGTISISDDLASRLTTIESDITNTLVVANRAYDDVEIADNVMTFTRGNGGTTQIEIPSGGEEWEDLDLTNLPKDFSAGDLMEMEINLLVSVSMSSTTWTGTPSSATIKSPTTVGTIIKIQFRIPENTESPYIPILIKTQKYLISFAILDTVAPSSYWNKSTSTTIMAIMYGGFNAGGCINNNLGITHSNASTYIISLKRKKTTS